MTMFLSVSLYVFAVFAVLGIIPGALLAAKERQRIMAAAVVALAVYVACALILAAGRLR